MQHKDYYVTSWYSWASKRSLEYTIANVSNHRKFFGYESLNSNNPLEVVKKLGKNVIANKRASVKDFLTYSIVMDIEKQATNIPSILSSVKIGLREKIFNISLIGVGTSLLYPTFLVASLRSSTLVQNLSFLDLFKTIHKEFGVAGLFTGFAGWALKTAVFCFASHLFDKLIEKLDERLGVTERELFFFEKNPLFYRPFEVAYFLGTNLLRALALSFFVTPIRNATLQRQLTLLPKILNSVTLIKPGIYSYASFVEAALKNKWSWVFKGFWFDVGYIFATGKPMF